MFEKLPVEVNFHIFSFFNKYELKIIAKVCKVYYEIACDERLLLRLIGFKKNELPPDWSEKLFQIYYSLFRLENNYFSYLLKNKILTTTELNHSLLVCGSILAENNPDLSVTYLNTFSKTSPLKVPCPNHFLYAEKNGYKEISHLIKEEKMSKDLKQNFNTLTHYSH